MMKKYAMSRFLAFALAMVLVSGPAFEVFWDMPKDAGPDARYAVTDGNVNLPEEPLYSQRVPWEAEENSGPS